MSHGRLIGLDTPDGIKKEFGVGYNILVEAKHKAELTDEQEKELLQRVEGILLNKKDFPLLVKSDDSNDKKLILMCPVYKSQELAEKIKEVEEKEPNA